MGRNLNIKKRGDRIKGYIKTRENNPRTVEVYREYIKFIRSAGCYKCDIEIVDRCEKMLNEAGYLTIGLQNILEKIFDKAIILIS